MAIDSTIRVNTWVAFAGNDENAVVDGDFAVTENYLRPAKSLREAGINIVAIHSHMIGEVKPGLFSFTVGDAVQPKASPKVSRKLYQPRLQTAKPRADVRTLASVTYYFDVI